MIRQSLNAMRFSSYLLRKRNRPPFYIIHFVTEKCPANCRHCFLSKERSDRPGEELTLDEIEDAASKMRPLLFVFLTGGEPLLRDDLAKIAMAYHHRAGVQKIQCPTNGYFPEKTEKFVRETCRNCSDLHLSVTVSFDAVGEKHDESRRLPGLFDRTVDTFKRMKRLEVKFPNFNVNATTTVSAYNQHELETVYHFLAEELDCHNYFNTLVRGKPRDPEASNVDLDAFNRFNNILDSALRKAQMRGYQRFPFADFVNAKNLISRRMIFDTARLRKYQTPCYAGSIAGVIYSHGEVYPCELRDDEMGNLRQWNYDLKALWRSEKAQKIRRDIHQSKCFCTHECFTTLNILFNLKYLPRLTGEVVKMKLKRWRLR